MNTAAAAHRPWPNSAMTAAVEAQWRAFEATARDTEAPDSHPLSTGPANSAAEIEATLPDAARARMHAWESSQSASETIFATACAKCFAPAAGPTPGAGSTPPAWPELFPFIDAPTPPTLVEELSALALSAALSRQSSTRPLELLELLLARSVHPPVQHAAQILQIRFQLLSGHPRDPEEVFQRVVQPARGAYQQAAAQLLLAQVIMSTRGPRHALRPARQAATAAARAHDRRTLAQALQLQAHLTATLGDPHAARPLYETSLLLHYAVNDLRRAGMAEGGLATLLDELGEPFAARDRLQRSLELHRRTGNRRSEAIQLCNLAILDERLGSCAHTQARFERAVEICREIGDRFTAGTTLVNLADHMQKVGRLARAHELYAEALALQRAGGHRRFEGVTLMNQARLHASTGDPQRAAQLFEQALATFRDVGDRVSEAETLAAIGALAERAGRLEEAISTQEQAGEIHRRAGNRAGAAEAQVALGNLYRRRHDPRRAAAAYRDALATFTALQRPLGIAVCHRHQATLHLDQGDHAAAEAAARQACAILEPLGDLLEEQRARHTLGRILRARGAHREAATQFTRALAAIEEWIQAIGNDRRRSRVLDETQPLYAEAVDLLFTDCGDPQRAFTSAERAKARSLLQLIHEPLPAPEAGATAAPDNPENPTAPAHPDNPAAAPPAAALAERRQGLELHLRSLQEALLEQKTTSGAAPGMIAYLETELRRVRAEHRQLLDQITFAHPTYAAARGWTPPLPPDAIRRHLLATPGVALLEYFVSADHVYAWLIRSDRIHAQTLPVTPADLAALVEKVTAPLRPIQPRLLRLHPRNLRRLAGILIDPLLPHLEEIQRLLVVPSGVLYQLPFEMLILQLPGESGWQPPAGADRYSAARYLAERFDLAYSPSATLFVKTPTPPPAPPANAPTVLALADPLYPQALPLPSSTAATQPPPLHLPPLPGTRRELELLRTLFPAIHPFAGAAARESAYRAHAPAADLIHLGCHGLVHPDDPTYTAVILSPGADRTEDAWLQSYEIAETPLPRAPIVVISACRVATGRLSAAEGLLGLSRAFLQAGARTVIASLWPLHDTHTVELISDFYRALAAAPTLDPIAAFGHARRAWIHTRRAAPDLTSAAPLSHPYFWAGFRVHGGG